MTTTEMPTKATVTAVPANVLRDAFTAALVAASTEPYLPVLNSVQVDKTGNALTFRGTDRFRLVRVVVTLDAPPEEDWEVLLPVADVKQILAALPRTGLYVAELGPNDDGRFGVTVVGGASLQVTPLDGEYPKTDSLIPTTTEAADQIAFNPKYLADVVKIPGHAKKAPVRFKLNGATKPTLAEWTDGVSAYLYLLMPVRIED